MLARLAVPVALALFACFGLAPSSAASPSFDCENARFEVERLICADDELAALDLEVAKAYARALSKAPARQVSELKSEQTAWRRELLRCERAEDERACTLNAFQSRLKQF